MPVVDCTSIDTEYVTAKEGHFENECKLKIYYKQWLPKDGKPKSILIFCHGIGEHCNRYNHLMNYLVKNNHCAVFALDHQGHGQSEGKRVDAVNGVSPFVRDINHLTRIALSASEDDSVKFSELPLFIAGLSFGGLLAPLTVLDSSYDWKGLVCLAAAIGVEASHILKVQKLFSSILNKVANSAHMVPAVKPEHMVQDPEELEAYMNDPYVETGNLRVNVGVASLNGMEQLQANKMEIKCPVLVLHGEDDKCTSPVMAKEFANTNGSSDSTFVGYPKTYHCILHEPVRFEVFEKISKWLASKMEGPGNEEEIKANL